MNIEPVPEGCLPLPGYIISVHSEEPAWLTIDGKVTHVWQERGIWQTLVEVERAVNQFCR